MSLFIEAVIAALPAIALLGGAYGGLIAEDPYADMPLDELPFVISAERMTEAQIRAALKAIGEIPEGAYVSIGAVEASDFEEGKEWPFSYGVNDLPPGFSVKPLDDTENPYRDEYGEWDVWEYENYKWLCDEYNFGQMSADEAFAFRTAEHDNPRLRDHGDHFLTIRGDGYLVPAAVVAGDQAADNAWGFGWGHAFFIEGEYYFFSVSTAFTIWSIGNMSEEMQDRRRTAENLARAPATPPIPRWLADNPPMWVEFIPDDEIITLGPLGSWDDEEVLSTGAWYRYSNDGRLLGQTAPGQQWWFEMFFPDFRQVWIDLGDIPEVQFQDRAGIITFCKYDPYEELAVYDYLGNPDPDPYRWHDQPMLFTIIEGSDIPAMYVRQQAVTTVESGQSEAGLDPS